MRFFIIISLLGVLWGLTACGSAKKQPQKPIERTLPLSTPMPPPLSTVNIPVRLKIWEIEHLLNKKMEGTIYEDNDLSDDGVKIKAVKSNWISIGINGLQLSYRVPLKLWVYKKVIGNTGIEAEGELALSFQTNLSMKNDWSIEPKTQLAGYEWIKNMAVKTGLGNIDIKYIANTIINRSQETLTKAIDAQLAAQFKMRAQVEEAWNTLQKPLSMTSTYGTWWVKLTPQNLEMSPLSSQQGVLQSNIAVQTLVEVEAGQAAPVFRPNTFLPPLKIGQNGGQNDFNIHLSTDIPLSEAQSLARSFAVGQVFEPAGRKIQITDVSLFVQDDKLVVNTFFSGSYNGSLYLIGKPFFDPKTNTIALQDLDFELNTKNFLLGSASWLFDRTILKKMQEACVFKLDDNVNYFKTTMNDWLKNYKLTPNVAVKGMVNDIKVNNIVLERDKIRVFIQSQGHLSVDVEGLDGF